MNRHFFLKNNPESSTRTIPLEEHISRWILKHSSPFHPPSSLQRILLALVHGMSSIVEKVSRSKPSVVNKSQFPIDIPVQSLLIKLLKKNIIASWYQYPFLPNKPRIVCCSLPLIPPPSPSGQLFRFQGLTGGGVGYTLNQALIPALAEALERHASCVWNPNHFVQGSFKDLKDMGAINPQTFITFSKDQLRKESFKRSRITKEQSLQWVRARSFLDNTSKLIPAQLVYFNYELEYPSEPIFSETTSNGAAAGSSFESATYSAICEAIERDSLLLFWLNNLSPPRILLESIDIPRVKRIIADVKRHNLELFVLNTTTNIGVPSFCSVLIDRHGDRAVSISAASDLDYRRAIEKTILEVLKFPLFEANRDSIQRESKQYQNVKTFREKEALWSDQKMISEIDFFLKGKEMEFSEIPDPQSSKNIKEKLEHIKNILKQEGHECYIVDITTSEAKQARLWVVKAIVPHLVPFFVDEKKRGLGVERLYSAPVTMGLRNHPLLEENLNKAPHPLL